MAEIRISDDSLARKAQTGDPESLRTLIHRLYPGVYAFVFRMLHHEEDARDVTQDVFLRMSAHIHEYRGEYKVTTWLFRIPINSARDILRTRNRKSADIDQVPETATELTGPEGLISRFEDRERVLDAVRRLPESVRECLLLAYQLGLPHAEIASMMGITANAVKLRVHKALQILRTELKRSGR